MRIVGIPVLAFLALNTLANGQEPSSQPAERHEPVIELLVGDTVLAVEKAGSKKVAAVDFTDLQGNVTELGRFLSEELSIGLVGRAKSFVVLDRTHLARLLRELDLNATALVDPKNAKKFGQLSGADALIVGTLTRLGDEIILNIKIIWTDTGAMVGATRGRLPLTPSLKQLLEETIWPEPGTGRNSRPAPESSKDTAALPEGSWQEFENLRVTLKSLQLRGRDEIVAYVIIANTREPKADDPSDLPSLRDSSHDAITAALKSRGGQEIAPGGYRFEDEKSTKDATGLAAVLLDDRGNQFPCVRASGFGLALDRGGWTVIPPGKQVPGSLVFKLGSNHNPRGSSLSVRLELYCFLDERCYRYHGVMPQVIGVHLSGVRLGRGDSDE